MTTADPGSFTAKQAEKASSYGIPCFVIQDDVYDTAKNAHHDVPAFAYKGQIYLRETIPSEWQDVSAVDHESVHAMRQTGYPPYMAFVENAPGHFNFHSRDAAKIFDRISAHVGVDISDMNEKLRQCTKQACVLRCKDQNMKQSSMGGNEHGKNGDFR